MNAHIMLEKQIKARARMVVVRVRVVVKEKGLVQRRDVGIAEGRITQTIAQRWGRVERLGKVRGKEKGRNVLYAAGQGTGNGSVQ